MYVSGGARNFMSALRLHSFLSSHNSHITLNANTVAYLLHIGHPYHQFLHEYVLKSTS